LYDKSRNQKVFFIIKLIVYKNRMSLLLKAEHESEYICEDCGARGENVRIDSWYWKLHPFGVCCKYITLYKEQKEARLEAGYDHDLAYRLYKSRLDIRNYGWVPLTAKEENNVESEEGEN